jgi:hypothetical protein
MQTKTAIPTRSKMLFFAVLHSHSSRKAVLKAAKVAVSGSVIGGIDAWQSKYYYIGHFGQEISIVYQGFFLAAALVAALVTLYDSEWSIPRNALNIFMAVPIATFADNISFDLQTMRAYIIVLPREGYAWRLGLFSHTAYYSLAKWVVLQSVVPGVINGYMGSILIVVAYIFIQILLPKMKL